MLKCAQHTALHRVLKRAPRDPTPSLPPGPNGTYFQCWGTFKVLDPDLNFVLAKSLVPDPDLMNANTKCLKNQDIYI